MSKLHKFGYNNCKYRKKECDAMPNSDRVPNRLKNEGSPYLLQHAYNPVDWFPWGKEAFEKAKSENKPIFLSIGYSTCHWCHVMAHESFEDEEVAALLNEDFISIKVDKEERPDIDAVYMRVCQSMTGGGGWPLTIIMTHDQKPFLAGTYFPKKAKYNVPGLVDILTAVKLEWDSNKGPLLKAANQIVQHLQNMDSKKKADQTADFKGSLLRELFTSAKITLEKSFDRVYGGFGRQPKFPMPHNIMFLLRYFQFEKDEKALEMAETTLRQMYQGGIFDHIGYGFARYSTDEKWLVPHFEKMLYDNALLVIAYLEAYQITGKELYQSVAARTMQYVSREMTDEEGGFYCAQDADSEGIEGKYYVFSPEEIKRVLGESEGDEFNEFYDITDSGNFEGHSIPNLIRNQHFESVTLNLKKQIEKLYPYRLSRTELRKDDKILTSWSALMIVAYAKAYRALKERRYLEAAERAVEFVRDNLVFKNDRLHVSYRNGNADGYGNLDDYAFFIWALLELYEATLDTTYMDQALQLGQTMILHFRDEEKGGFYLTDKTAENLICRPKETYDGAIPSGNSVAGYILVKIYKLTGKPDYLEYSREQLEFLYQNAVDYPAGHSFALMALMMEFYPESFLCENGVCS